MSDIPDPIVVRLGDWLREHRGWDTVDVDELCMALRAVPDAVFVLAGPGACWRPAWAVHPGEILQEEITERGMTQVELAGALGFSAKHVNMLIKGNADIEAPCALRLEHVLGISAEMWLGLQAAWDLHQLRAAGEATQGSAT